jgi:glycosyltransferase involved in cell wall biosynthesis
MNERDGRISVVVPAHREREHLYETLESVPAFVDHVVVVDDGSEDGTYRCAVEYSRDDPRVEAIRFAYNHGVGAAIVRGYRRALRDGADVVSVMAGDGQMDPDDLRRVVAPVLKGEADYAKGNRLDHPAAHAMPPIRRFGTWVLSLLTGGIAGYERLRDSQCGYTAISRELLESLSLESVYSSYGYPNDLLLRVGARGATLAQPVVRPVYGGEESGLSVPDVLGPIGGILIRGLLRRIHGHSSRLPRAAESHAHSNCQQ